MNGHRGGLGLAPPPAQNPAYRPTGAFGRRRALTQPSQVRGNAEDQGAAESSLDTTPPQGYDLSLQHFLKPEGFAIVIIEEAETPAVWAPRCNTAAPCGFPGRGAPGARDRKLGGRCRRKAKTAGTRPILPAQLSRTRHMVRMHGWRPAPTCGITPKSNERSACNEETLAIPQQSRLDLLSQMAFLPLKCRGTVV